MLTFIYFWLTVSLLGLAVLPIANKLFSRLYDRGFVFSKALGILLPSYTLWILAAFKILSYSRVSIFLIIAFFTLPAWLLAGKETIAFLRRRKHFLVLTEVIFLLIFALFAFLRAHNPELNNGEKPIDMAFAGSILRSKYFPPIDPWFSGFSINYYYFGHLMMATLAKLTGVKMALAFNLEIALVFALSFIAIFGLVFDLIIASAKKPAKKNLPHQPLLFAFLTAFVAIIAGNFEMCLEFLHSRGFGSAGFWQFINIPGLTKPSLSPHQPLSWWRASRLMPDAITEFPYFSLLLGDLHPHVIAFPFAIMAVGLALNELRGGGLTITRKKAKDWLGFFVRAFLVALCLGSLGFIHTPDFPIYLTLWIMALIIRQFLSSRTINLTMLKGLLLPSVLVTGLAFLLYSPYHLNVRMANIQLTSSLSGPRIGLHHFLLQFGLFLFVVVSYLIFLRSRLGRPFPLILLVTVILLLILKLYLFALLAGLTTFVLPLVFWFIIHRSAKKDFPPKSILFVLILIPFVCLLAFLSETIYNFGHRSDTIFKFYYPIWLLLAIPAGFGAYHLYISSSASKLRWLFVRIGLILLLATLAYPKLATAQKIRESRFSSRPTLDGLAFLREESPSEYQAIEWLRTSIKDSPIVLELPGQSWSSGSRVSAYTGLPTLIGWITHERGRRERATENGPQFSLVDERLKDIDLIYGGGDETTTKALIDKYNIEYIYVGGLERKKYYDSPDKLEDYMEIAFQNDKVTIYKKPSSNTLNPTP